MSVPETSVPTNAELNQAARAIFDAAIRESYTFARGMEFPVAVPEQYSGIERWRLRGALNLQQRNQPSLKVIFLDIPNDDELNAVFTPR